MNLVCEFIVRPLKIIDELFKDGSVSSRKFHLNVKKYFEEKLQNIELEQSIPSLNDVPLHQLRTNTLVRYRCMVQDMFDPEYFLGVYMVRSKSVDAASANIKCLGLYRDLAQCGPDEKVLLDAADNVTMDRQTLYCVPIPGENQWSKLCYAKKGQSVETPSTSSTGQRTKRPVEDDNGELEMEVTTQKKDGTQGRADSQLKSSKAERAENDSDTAGGIVTEVNDVMETDNKYIDNTAYSGDRKKLKTECDCEENKMKSTLQPDLNFPLPEEEGPACLVKIYDTLDGFKVNDMVEFVGVLSNDPAMADFPTEQSESDSKSAFANPAEMELDLAEHQAHCPPPSLVPRLHVVKTTVLAHSNPLLPRDLKESSTTEEEFASLASKVRESRAVLVDVLQEMLFGDALAAEYLVCHLISTVYTRQDIVAMGKFSLNISGCPRNSQFVSLFYNILQSHVPKSYCLPLTVERLNTCKFTPRKDYNLNRLTSGALQLSDNTNLVIDETAMQPGHLDDRGVKNLTAIGTVISWQKCEYDFNYHKQEFHTNINVLVMSEGKSLLNCDCQCPLSVCDVSGDELQRRMTHIHERLVPELLTRLRFCLGVAQRLPYAPLPTELQQEIENNFVEVRKNNRKDMTVDDLHMLLTLARLVSLSHGETTLSREMWEKTKEMEFARKQRFTTTAKTA